MGWDERDEIPEVVLCWDCNPKVRAAREAAAGDEHKEKQVGRVTTELKRLAIKRSREWLRLMSCSSCLLTRSRRQ
jgi:hypothetical protein